MSEAPINILVVDDEPELQSLIQMEFRKKIRQNQFQFSFATNGQEALDKIEKSANLDLILCDLNMPIMDGFDLLNRLNAKNYLLKAIVVSAYGDIRNIRSAMNLGAFDFVMKPIEFEDLETTIFNGFKEVTQLRDAASTRKQLKETEENLDLVEEKALRLSELDELKTRLFTHFSHEFRTPLTVIKGLADQIAQNPHKWATSGSEVIRRNTDYLLRLVNQILDLRKIEAGKLQLQAQTIDLAFLFRYAVESLATLASAKDIICHFSSQEECLICQADEAKILQIVSNLVSNAIKYTPIGGEVFVDLHWQIEAQMVQVTWTVRDTGMGIAEAQLPHIFDQFYQAHQEKVIGGSGIGLTLSRELVSLMEGEIEVMSKLGEGSCFTVKLSLPLAHEQDLAPSAPPKSHAPLGFPEPPIPAQGELELARLLIVEDNPDIQRYLLACLEDEYALSLASNGQKGLEMALAEIPDLILSDVMMPGLDGYELCKRLKSEERTSHIPIILLTAKADIDSRLKGLDLGADAYLAKPFEKRELSVRLRRLLEIRQNLQKRYQTGGKPTATDHPITKRQDAFILKFRQLLFEHIDDSSFDVPKMCEAIGMSRSSLHRKLKALTGMSTTHFMNKLRLEKGHEYLNHSDWNISDIAYATGFSSLAQFSKSYRMMYGLSPSESRKQS